MSKPRIRRTGGAQVESINMSRGGQRYYLVSNLELEQLGQPNELTGFCSLAIGTSTAALSTAGSFLIAGNISAAVMSGALAVFAGIVAKHLWPSKDRNDELIKKIKEESIEPSSPQPPSDASMGAGAKKSAGDIELALRAVRSLRERGRPHRVSESGRRRLDERQPPGALPGLPHPKDPPRK